MSYGRRLHSAFDLAPVNTQLLTLPFRFIAIAGSSRSIDRSIEMARSSSRPIGLMLRDRFHDRERTARLVEYFHLRNPVGPIVAISNGYGDLGLESVHFPSKHLQSLHAPTNRQFRGWRGYSTHNMSQVCRANELRADYVAFGPVFPPKSKVGGKPSGLAGLHDACKSSQCPVFAIGGVDATNFRDCIEAGAYGIASIWLTDPENAESASLVIRGLDQDAHCPIDRRVGL